MKNKYLPFDKIELSGGFFWQKQKLIRDVTLDSVYDRFSDTGRIGAFEMNYKEGEPNRPHFFWDSDVAKWMESVAYLTATEKMPEEEARVDHLVDCIERGRLENGYFNIYFEQIEPDMIFKNRDWHELYCAGHLLEAAVAYYKATGKRKFLDLMTDYMELIEKTFKTENSAAFSSPGHEEIELALVKLYDLTGEKRWLDLSLHFVNMRGRGEKPGLDSAHSDYNQDHLPVREQFTAEGHAVRACYLYCAMADLALRCDDEGLKTACERLFDNIVERKMYITGGIGSTAAGERFEGDFVLPNDTAYAETCAALALALFARRMSLLSDDAKYADIAEKVIYNGFLSGLSLDGKSFFYENAQEINLSERKNRPGTHFPITERVEIFGCSCCPPNVTRFIPSIADFMYAYNDEVVFVNQYMNGTAHFDGFDIIQKTDYPFDENVNLTVTADVRLALRIPFWCDDYTVCINGKAVNAAKVKGYVYIDTKKNDDISLTLEIKPKYNRADPRVPADKGLLSVSYGPFIMCAEGIDNPHLNESTLTGTEIKVTEGKFNLPAVLVPADPQPLYMIPYHAFANRGECDMKIWVKNG